MKLNVLTTSLLCALSFNTFAATKVEKAVIDSNASYSSKYNLQNADEFNNAARGFIAKPSGQIKNEQGDVIWDFDAFNFIKDQAPDTVNPILWRQAKLNNNVGLFKVADRVWQVRGFDLANMTIIQGKSGWIIVDTLTSKETAEAAIKFARQHLGDQKISAIIFTHSHVDHFGGALGVISTEKLKQKKIPIIAPEGFMEEATSENIMAGPAMTRRATYMYGTYLPKNTEGLVDNGLGKAVAVGQIGILEPNQLITQKEQKLNIDGLDFVFYNVPSSEAPSELTFSIPSLKLYNGAEILSHTLHNLYTLRGAKVRDTLKWVSYLSQALEQTQNSEVFIAQHHWPVWGNQNIQDFIKTQRDVYKFIHDQTVRYMNSGLNGAEIAEKIKLPPELDQKLYAHGYYGTLKHNAKAVYQYYMGWFDANPSNLDPLPPKDAAKKYIELAGGEANALKNAQEAYNKAEYRWAAEVLKYVVFNNPANSQAKDLLAKTYRQLGYSAEAATWRNFYLSGAQELQGFTPLKSTSGRLGLLIHTPTERFLEAMATNLDVENLKNENQCMNLVLTDTQENFSLRIENSVMIFDKYENDRLPTNCPTLKLTKLLYLQLITGGADASKVLVSKDSEVKGNPLKIGKFFSLFKKSNNGFPIVTRPKS
ncbi:MBL fold metallo-hydrolase [Acinetobacter sp. P1(2023)]|uniref:alkyl/aryl-sulfatase n=1 Tax=unclassified Acinetobacter TaxID=196816 RepID=UPI0021CD7B02|nr:MULTISPECIES: alkyl sulfatase dimerization domain-containing protein [unclassified Acinetobacter]MCU4531510.1 MBL fold metallo-hydrolase [Acinetobacter sp. WU_MDCI_Abxe169]MDC0843576.1 MBL fold metallo-hydrolase [Acinetobacter sp. P1(2023)]